MQPLIRRILYILALLTSLSFIVSTQDMHSSMSPVLPPIKKLTVPTPPKPEATLPLPPDERDALNVLSTTDIRTEFMYIDGKAGTRAKKIEVWIAYPERAEKAPVIILLHEVTGLTPWVRATAVRFAQAGYITIAPDFLWGLGKKGGGTDSLTQDEAVIAVSRLSSKQVMADLDSISKYAYKFPGANTALGLVGFSWGGTVALAYAGINPDIRAVVNFYGLAPKLERINATKASILSVYGGRDVSITDSAARAEYLYQRQHKIFEKAIYADASHSFMRQQYTTTNANFLATRQAWPRTIQFLKTHLHPEYQYFYRSKKDKNNYTLDNDIDNRPPVRAPYPGNLNDKITAGTAPNGGQYYSITTPSNGQDSGEQSTQDGSDATGQDTNGGSQTINNDDGSVTTITKNSDGSSTRTTFYPDGTTQSETVQSTVK